MKIEGRLKGLDYVKNVTAYYRQQLDTLLEQRPALARAWSGVRRLTDPAKSFHRGHTDYFLHGRQPDITAFASPKFAGEPVGTVARVSSAGKGAPVAVSTSVRRRA